MTDKKETESDGLRSRCLERSREDNAERQIDRVKCRERERGRNRQKKRG